MRDFVEMLNTVKEEHPDAAQFYLGPVLDDWMTNMLLFLKSSPSTEFGDYGLRLEVLNVKNHKIFYFFKFHAIDSIYIQYIQLIIYFILFFFIF